MEHHIEKLKALVSKCRVGMLGTREENTVRFRPMSHVDIDDQGKIWFFATLDQAKIDEIQNNPTVFLTYANENEMLYLSIEGMAFLNTDKEIMKELFTPYVKAWIPQGLRDPDLVLLVVHPLEVEYWVNDNKVMNYSKMLAGTGSGTPPPKGKHRRLAL
jgi:general stress protein 26